MKKKEVKPLEGKDIRLAFSNGYQIDGKILKIIDDTVFFQLENVEFSNKLWGAGK